MTPSNTLITPSNQRFRVIIPGWLIMLCIMRGDNRSVRWLGRRCWSGGRRSLECGLRHVRLRSGPWERPGGRPGEVPGVCGEGWWWIQDRVGE